MIATTRSPDAPAANAYFRGGKWEYRRNITGPASEQDRVVIIEFEGVYRDATVVVNGETVHRRPNGYSLFQVPIDAFLRSDNNDLRVEVTAGDDSRWYSGAGIYRDVWLLESGRVHLGAQGLTIRTPEVDDEAAVITIDAVVHNQTTRLCVPNLVIEIVDADGSVVATAESPVTAFPGEGAAVRQRVVVPNPLRWSPTDPRLYECRATLRLGDNPLDTDAATFGIRTLSLDARRGLRINGEPVLLRGACVHHDNGPIGAATIRRADERRVELLKAAGFNAIRSAHNPMSRAMLDACDRHGVLVMDEAFDMWSQPKSDEDYSRRFDDWWEADVEAMVQNSRNHPSVVLYSIGNEIPDGSLPIGLRIGRQLAAKVRDLDHTRYVTQAVTGLLVGGPELFAELRAAGSSAAPDENSGVNSAAMSLGEMLRNIVKSPVVDAKTIEAFAPLDVAGYNYMDTRYALDVQLHPDRVIVGTESHPPAIAAVWSQVTALPNVIGDFTWTGWDYLGEVGIGRLSYADADAGNGFHADYPWRTAWCADLDITGHRRPQSYCREIVFGLRTDPYIGVVRPQNLGRELVRSSPWAWSDVVPGWTWPGFEGIELAVEVYAPDGEVELLLNGQSLGRRNTIRNCAAFPVVFAPGELVAIAWKGDIEIGRNVVSSIVGDVSICLSVDRADVVADQHDLAFIEISLADQSGTVSLIDDCVISVAVEGPGVLQGLGSPAPDADEQFSANSCRTFDGRAIAVIRPTGSGCITVTVCADGRGSEHVTITANPGQ